MNEYEVSGVIFLDPKKVFDLVDHDILLKKLTIYLKNSFLYHLKTTTYLRNRTQCVLLHGSYSSKESVKYGVPQASILRPIRFSLYQWPPITRETYICWLRHAGSWHVQHCTNLERQKNLQNQKQYARQLYQVPIWCDINHMVINPIKTKSMTTATRHKHQLSPLLLDLVLNGAKIDQVSEHRLLRIDNKLRWDHVLIMCVQQFQDKSSFCRN